MSLILILSLIFTVLIMVREYLKITDREHKYIHPKFASAMTLFCFLSIDGAFSLLFIRLGVNALTAELLAVSNSFAITPICFMVSKKLSAVIRKSEEIDEEKLIDCTGMAVGSINSDGGSVCVIYKNRYIDARAVSDDEIKSGERIKVIGFHDGSLVCTKKQ